VYIQIKGENSGVGVLRAVGGVHSHTLGLVRIADCSHPHPHLCYNVAAWQNNDDTDT